MRVQEVSMALTKKDLLAIRKINRESLNELRKKDLAGLRKTHKEGLNELRAEFRKTHSEGLSEFKEELRTTDFAELRAEFRAGLDELSKEIDGKVDQGVGVLKVLIEDVRGDIKLLAEGREFHVEKLDTHGRKLENHEGRITTLEDVVYTKNKYKT